MLKVIFLFIILITKCDNKIKGTNNYRGKKQKK